jgi:hypothetical protein
MYECDCAASAHVVGSPPVVGVPESGTPPSPKLPEEEGPPPLEPELLPKPGGPPELEPEPPDPLEPPSL